MNNLNDDDLFELDTSWIDEFEKMDNDEPINLKTFLRSKECAFKIGNHFLQPIKNIDSISFDKTIGMFQDINDLFIIFYNKNDIKNTNTNTNTNKTTPNNISTRKIYLNPNSFKKTRRNLFKDMIT